MKANRSERGAYTEAAMRPAGAERLKEANRQAREKSRIARGIGRQEIVSGDRRSEAMKKLGPRNKLAGILREEKVERRLKRQFPDKSGYQVLRERVLRDTDGRIVLDRDGGRYRRIDFVVVQKGRAVKCLEVTSPKADKKSQMEKERLVRGRGGNWVERSRDERPLISVRRLQTVIDREV